ncbi:MAG: Ig-like domain-containing protein [Nitrospirae bacterium]|nr:Ig-like domain-containing protein [Nitrospirota bacterium]
MKRIANGLCILPLLAAMMFMALAAPSVAAAAGSGIRLSWQSPKDVDAASVVGYNVYRSKSILGHYERVGDAPVKTPGFDDAGLVDGTVYYYRVTTVFADGGESRPTQPVGMKAGASPGTKQVGLPRIQFFTSDALGKVTYMGEEAVFMLEADPGLTATVDIPGAADGIRMEELKPGTYRGSFRVPGGLMLGDARAVVTVMDEAGGRAVAETPPTLSFSGVTRPGFSGLYAGIVEPDRVGLNWPTRDGEDVRYSVYRDSVGIIDLAGLAPLSSNIYGGVTAYIDTDLVPGETYYYVLAVAGPNGDVIDYSANLKVTVPVSSGRRGIASVEEDSSGRVLRPGDTLTVTARTVPGGKAAFTLGTAVRDGSMPETEPGVYRGGYTVREGDGVFKVRVAVSFRDSYGSASFANSGTFVTVDAPRSAGSAAAAGDRPRVHGISDDIRSAAGPSGRLTAGRTFTVTMTGEPGNKAYFSVGEGIWKVPMTEAPDSPGTYTGSYTVRPGDSAGMNPDPLAAVYLTGYLEGPTGAVSEPEQAAEPVVVDTTVDIKVETSISSLPADARSQAKVTFTVTDADGEPVADRRISVLLEAPPRYTGVVGAGGVGALPPDEAFGLAQASDAGRLEVDFDDLTNTRGEVTATYTSGFAAKTAMLVARDFITGSVGMGYITTSLTSSVNITLEDPAGAPAVSAPEDAAYQLDVVMEPDPANPVRVYEGFVVEAVPDTLTADGVSRAAVIATLTKDGVPVEGKTVVFSVGGAGGSLTMTSCVTDMSGRAQVFYIAGTKAGKALITATETSTGVSAVKVVTLLADAPAKIYVRAYPDSIPADGASSSRVVVEVADVNDNPTEGVSVGFLLRGGQEQGMVSVDGAVTDFRGACDFIYSAGTSPGVATIDVTASSGAPTYEELAGAMSAVVAPLVYDNMEFTELTVLSWYKAIGDKVGRGEPVAVVGTPLGEMTVYAPVSGELEDITVWQGINVIEGEEIGRIR